jgi:acetyl-CoA carboxylase biotin carboxyl carrier protein
MTTPATGDSTPDVASLGTAVRDIVGKLPGSLRRIMVQVNGCVVEVEWDNREGGPIAGAPVAIGAASTAPAGGDTPALESEAEGVLTVTATVVGCFYRRPSPDAPPFVEIGDTIEKGAQIGLIETMKLYTPVTSEHAGRVVAVHAQDGDMVEFGQKLLDLAAE